MKQIAIVTVLFISVGISPVWSVTEKEAKETEEEQQPVLIHSVESDRGLRGGGERDVTFEDALFRLSGMGMFAASAADVATTEWGLRHPGLDEGNPLVSNRSFRMAAHIAAPAAVWWTTERIHKSGHRRLALILRIGLMAAYGYAAARNFHTIQNR